MDTGLLLLFAFVLIVLGSLIILIMTGLKASNRTVGWAAFTFICVAAIMLASVCGSVLTTGKALTANFSVFTVDAIHASLRLCVDQLSAFFMLVVIVLSLPVMLFSVAYMETEKDIRGYYTPLMLFIAGMLGVLCVDDFFFFFIPWEFMSLSAYALIIFEKDEPRALRAGLKYFIVTHFGNVCMAIGAIILYFNLPDQEASFSFPAIARSMQIAADTKPALLNLSLALLFLGFATKAGLVPFGMLWLPDAHPAAPSPVSSLLSGAMIKIGMYGFVRTFLFLLPIGVLTETWGWILAAFGVVSLFIGTLRAMMQHDSKVLLAYHSIGQIGYIALALGLGMAFMGTLPVIAFVGLTAGLYHLVNHACFKALLFLNAGSVIHKTGMRNMDDLGGLSRMLPITSVCTLIAVFSIGGLPGFSGFVSKWMIYQTAIFGGIQNPWSILMGIVAVFVSVVTIISVLKFYSAQFLGHVPDHLKKVTRGEDAKILIPQVFLAVLCVIFGIVPILGVLPGISIFMNLPGLRSAEPNVVFGALNPFRIVLHAETGTGAISTIGIWNPLLTGTVVVALGWFGYLVRRSGRVPVRRVQNWYCGSLVHDNDTIYRSSSYYKYVKEYFTLLNTRLVPTRFEFRTDLSRILNIDNWFYYPCCRLFLVLSKWVARSHIGIPQIYILWTIIGAAITIIIAFLII